MKLEDLQDKEAESAVIATLLYNPSFIYHTEALTPRDFYNIANGCLFWAIKELVESGTAKIDAFSLSNTLQSHKAVAKKIKAIPISSINDLFDLGQQVSRDNVIDYKALVKKITSLSLRREMYNQLNRCLTVCLNTGNDGIDVQGKIYELIEEVSRKFALTEYIQSFPEKIDRLWDNIQNKESGIPLKSKSWGEYVELSKGELLLIGAGAKVGKSALLLTETVELLRKGKSVLVIDSELSDELYTLRLISHISRIEFKVVKGLDYTSQQKIEIDKAIEFIKGSNLYHFYTPIFDDAEMFTLIKRVNIMCKIDVLVVDYFKNTSTGNAYDVSQAMGNTVDMIKNNVCGAMGICGLGAVQTTDGGAVALSKNIARSTSTLITLIRKTTQEQETDGYACGDTKVRVAFNRNGAQHSEEDYIDMKFTGSILDYSEAKQHEVIKPY